jgi:putative transposase
LLVKDSSKQEISASMQLLSGCVAQEYNCRKGRKDAFWEDRYHATAVATDDHLRECLLYIDLNMVRAGVVNHYGDWHESGFSELLAKSQRYKILGTNALMELLGIGEHEQLIMQRKEWVTQALDSGLGEYTKDPRWTGGIVIGSYGFVESVQLGLGPSVRGRSIVEYEGSCVLREAGVEYRVTQGET